MITLKRSKKEPSDLEKAIAELYSDLQSYPSDSPEYDRISNQLKKLTKLKTTEVKRRVSPDTLALILGNAAVALIVVGYESKHVVTSKVGSFLMKAR